MTPADIELVQQGFSRSIVSADALACDFYDRLFRAEPGLRSMFADDMREQRSKLMLTLATVVQNLHKLNALMPAVRSLAKRHVGYGVENRHYALVGDALLDALAASVRGFDDRQRAAWAAAYSAIAAAMLTAAAE